MVHGLDSTSGAGSSELGANIQHLQHVRLPTGRSLGGLDVAYDLISRLEADPSATLDDEVTGRSYALHVLDFEHHLAFGNHFIQIDICVPPKPALLERVHVVTGIAYGYALYWL